MQYRELIDYAVEHLNVIQDKVHYTIEEHEYSEEDYKLVAIKSHTNKYNGVGKIIYLRQGYRKDVEFNDLWKWIVEDMLVSGLFATTQQSYNENIFIA